jgi:serine/threonine protein kinase
VEEDPDGLLYLEREVNVLKGMRHPNIVQFIGIAVVRWFSLSSFFHSSFSFSFSFFFARFRSFSCETKVLVVLIGGWHHQT